MFALLIACTGSSSLLDDSVLDSEEVDLIEEAWNNARVVDCFYSQNHNTSTSPAVIDSYCDGDTLDGNEDLYAYTSEVSETTYVTACPNDGTELILTMISSDLGTCQGDTGDVLECQEVVFEAVAGETYFFSVDSAAGQEGAYYFNIDCSR